MRYIKKGESPQNILDWFQGQFIDGKHINCRFEELDPDVKADLKQRLIMEQGWLCCYTGLTIDINSSHFEHVFPQSFSRRNGTHEDVDYHNMLLAFPKDGKCDFGAKVRGDSLLPVHPLQEDCDSKFKYDVEGRVSGVDMLADKTIDLLKLSLLDYERRAAITEVLFPDDVILTPEDYQEIAQGYNKPNAEGKLNKFCFVIAYVAQEILNA